MKRSLRDYLLTIGIALLIFTVVAFFLLEIAENLMSDVMHKVGENEETTQTFAPVETGGVIPTPGGNQSGDTTHTFLFLGLDQMSQSADAIFLVGINETKKEAAVSVIPSDTLVNDGSQKMRLGEVYAKRGISYVKEIVARETGISVDFYAVLNMSAVENTIDFLGGMQYTVPQDMYYFDLRQNLIINLRAGPQVLTGNQALQLLRFREYEENGDDQRRQTQLDFVRSFIAEFLKPENLPQAKSILYNVFYNVISDFQESDLDALGSVLFGLQNYSQSYLCVPGEMADGYFVINSNRTKTLFQEYR